MKRALYICLLLLMLTLFIVPLPILAADPTYTPWDYLDETEKAYVTSVRSWITVTKTRIDTAKTDLGTFFLQDYYTWYPAFLGELSSINDGLTEIKNISAPDYFLGVYSECQSLSGVSIDYAAMVLDPMIAPTDLNMAAQAIAGLDSRMDKVKGNLDKIWASMDKRINEIAKAEKLGEEFLSRWIESCDKSDTP